MVASHIALRLTWRYLLMIIIGMFGASHFMPHLYHVDPGASLQEMLLHERLFEASHMPLCLITFIVMSFTKYKTFKISFGEGELFQRIKVWWAWHWRSWPIVSVIAIGLQWLNFQTMRQFEWVYYIISAVACFYVDYRVMKYLLSKKADVLKIRIEVLE